MLPFREAAGSALAQKLLERIIDKAMLLAGRLGRRPVFMEVCGTHTMAVSRSGLRSLLNGVMELRSGPGCPVCVTPGECIDAAIALARLPGTTIATFGDMLRVPGSASTLELEKACGADVRAVYSPLAAVDLAEGFQGREVIFVGTGFETTAPAVALSIIEAKRRNLNNFSVFSLHKLMPPALRALLTDRGFAIDGLLLPGHVCTVTGRKAFEFVAADYGVPAVITGFETIDILKGILELEGIVDRGMPEVINGYPSAVCESGNRKALEAIDACFDVAGSTWRGIGLIPGSGLKLKKHLKGFDAENKFPISRICVSFPEKGCSCGKVLRGQISPSECPLFGKTCTPARPAGPCMVSAEGACAAYYQYERLNPAERGWSRAQ